MAQSERVHDPRMGAREWAMLIALSTLWGGSFFFFKVLGRELPPLTVVFGRVGFAAVARHAFLALRGDVIPADWRLWRSFLTMGLLNNIVPFALIAFGETRVASGVAAILNATTPLFTILAAHVWTAHEKITGPKAVGILLGFAGVAILIGPGSPTGAGNSGLIGDAACLLAALSYAFAGIFGRRFRAMDPLKVATGQVTASAIVLLPLSLSFDHP